MSGRAGPIAAQTGAEVKMRLRSPATLAAVLIVFVGSVLWIPDPKGNASSLSWRLADGRVQAPVYSTAYVGFAASALVCITVALVGFYLVAGSVRRDRESGVGAILAATPLSRTEYLAGKFVADCAYLFVVVGLALLAAVTAWLRFGVGPFSASDLLGVFVLLAVPAVAVTASLTVLFDVTPGLSGRGGYVAWFFVFSLALVAVPMALAGTDAKGVMRREPLIDPVGAATQAALARQTVPGAVGFSTGLEIRDEPFPRVPWPGIRVTPKLVAGRAINLLLALLPLALAISIFDRFDPARGARKGRKPGFLARRAARRVAAVPAAAQEAVFAVPRGLLVAPDPATAHPSALRAVLAETRLIWESASWLKWPLLVSAVVAPIVPVPMVVGAFLVLLIPAVSEVAAREDLAGTRAMVFSQPGVPSSTVLWKAASVALFLVVLAAPLAIRVFVTAPIRGFALVAGVFFVACAAVGFGSLTAGGKLFSGVYLVLWYMALNNLPAADFSGALSRTPVYLYSVLYLLGGAALVAVAAIRERARRG